MQAVDVTNPDRYRWVARSGIHFAPRSRQIVVVTPTGAREILACRYLEARVLPDPPDLDCGCGRRFDTVAAYSNHLPECEEP